MRAKGIRQPILLFVLTVVFPGLVLTAFTLRMIRQEKELAHTRMAEERRRVAEACGQALLSRLESLKSQIEKSLIDNPDLINRAADLISGIVLVAPIEAGELRLPWEGHSLNSYGRSASPGYQALIEAHRGNEKRPHRVFQE